MASIFTHGFIAYGIRKMMPGKTIPKNVAAAGIMLSMIPDADVIGFSFGVPYESMFGHRGFTHSLSFAILAAALISLLFIRKKTAGQTGFLKIFLFLFLCTASHGILDAMTSGGLGVGFFIPFENSRYFFAWRPVLVSPIGIGNFLSPWGIAVLKSEFIYLWIPVIILMTGAYFLRKRFRKNSPY